MINNPESFPMTYRVNKQVANWLIYQRGIPLLGIKNEIYYFTHNYETYKAIKELPLWLKLLQFLNI